MKQYGPILWFGLAAPAAWMLVFPGNVGAQPITREGAYYRQNVTGTMGLQTTKLYITTRGEVVVRGEQTNNATPSVSWVLVKRAKAGNPEHAGERLSPYNVTTHRQGEWTMVELTGDTDGDAQLNMELRVPRSIKQLVVRTRWGSVKTYDIEGGVQAESGGGALFMDRIGGDVLAKTGGGEVMLGRIGGSLRCHTGGGTIRVDSIGASAEFSTSGGEIFVREVKGTLRAATGGGNIHVERAGGEVISNTQGGLIEIGQAGGAVVAGTQGGSIDVTGAPKGVRCESGNGTIRLKGVSGALRAMTAQGMILAEIPMGAVIENSMLAARSGDIIVYLPSNLAVTVRARNDSGSTGRIVSEFDEVKAGTSRGRLTIAEGTLNGGGPVLELAVSGGNIYLRRQKQ